MIYLCPCGGPNSIWSGQPYHNAAQKPGICIDCRGEARRARRRMENTIILEEEVFQPTRYLGSFRPRGGIGRHKGLKIPRLKAV